MTTIEDARSEWDERIPPGTERLQNPEDPYMMPRRITASEHDVIFSMVGNKVVLSNKHPGNHYFLEVLDDARKTYLTTVQGDENELYRDIIHLILKNGSQFLATEVCYHAMRRLARDGEGFSLLTEQPDEQDMRKLERAMRNLEGNFAGRFEPMQNLWVIAICKDLLKTVANPYASYVRALGLFQVLFSDEEKAKFQAWASTTATLVPHEEDLSILSRYEPFRAMCNTVDSSRRVYPLQRAVQIGLRWHEGVKQIFEACDEIVQFPDPEHGLLPFQLAAAWSTDDASVNLSYNLLRVCPDLVWQWLLNPNDMRHRQESSTAGYVFEKEDDIEKEEDVDWDNVGYMYSSSEECSHASSNDEDSDVGC